MKLESLLFVLVSLSAAPPAFAGHDGTITGTVVNDAGEPLSGAYVGTGDFGDSGGSNYARHREEGLFASARTDAAGRFELDGLREAVHPLMVTHDGYVPHREDVEITGDEAVRVSVRLEPAASIRAVVVRRDGRSVEGPILLRLEALDGHRFIPPDRDPHLSAFAASTWLEPVAGAEHTFGELKSGDYSLSVFHLQVPPGGRSPGPGGIALVSPIRFHGSAASVIAPAARSTVVTVKPEEHETRVSLELPKPPEGTRPGWMTKPYLVVSRNLGLLTWDDGRFHSPEDPRLGRLAKQALFHGFVLEERTFVVENLPPGSYAVFAGSIVALQGQRIEVSAKASTALELPWKEPTEPARVGTSRFDRTVDLENRPYGAAELGRVLTEALEGKPRFRVDAALSQETWRPNAGELSVWETLERVYREKGWRPAESGVDTFVLERGRE